MCKYAAAVLERGRHLSGVAICCRQGRHHDCGGVRKFGHGVQAPCSCKCHKKGISHEPVRKTG